MKEKALVWQGEEERRKSGEKSSWKMRHEGDLIKSGRGNQWGHSLPVGIGARTTAVLNFLV